MEDAIINEVFALLEGIDDSLATGDANNALHKTHMAMSIIKKYREEQKS